MGFLGRINMQQMSRLFGKIFSSSTCIYVLLFLFYLQYLAVARKLCKLSRDPFSSPLRFLG